MYNNVLLSSKLDLLRRNAHCEGSELTLTSRSYHEYQPLHLFEKAEQLNISSLLANSSLVSSIRTPPLSNDDRLYGIGSDL